MLSEKEFEAVECLLCGHSQTHLIAEEGQFGWPTYVSICENCGLVFLNPRWTKEDYLHFYASEYDQFYRFDESQAKEKELRKAKIVWKRLQAHVPTQFSSALDIGCGLGWNLYNLSQEVPGMQMAGIEPSDHCAEHFVGEIGGDLIARDVDSDWHLAHQGQYDLVVFRHVLEHLLDPIATLKKVSQALSPQGVLYIAVPDMMHPDGSLSDFWFRCVHTYYFSKTTLARVAAQAGLQAVTIKEEKSELWAIFKQAQSAQPVEPVSVYRAQMAAFNAYKRKRLLRSVLLRFSPRKISRWTPKWIKNLVPKSLKNKFRSLVYRH
ncbi:MAG: class I SAM-dependent methyltransferase [Anaerolineales bacterium]|jgi:2-polyprenyl-3-methyl-5-hydroxy-6-metoxy-1,4-benzoquinol methylase